MSMQYITDTYKVPAKVGGRVKMSGKPGVITGADGAYIKVRFDGEKHSSNCHPTWEMEYEAD